MIAYNKIFAILAVLAMVMAGVAVVSTTSDAGTVANDPDIEGVDITIDAKTGIVTMEYALDADDNFKSDVMDAITDVLGTSVIMDASFFKVSVPADTVKASEELKEKIEYLEDECNFEVDTEDDDKVITAYFDKVNALEGKVLKKAYTYLKDVAAANLLEINQIVTVSVDAPSIANIEVAYEAQIEAKEVLIKAAEARIADLEAQVEVLSKDKSEFIEAIKVLQTEKAALEEQVATLTAEKVALETQVADLEKQLEDVKKADADKITLYQALTGVFAFVAIVLVGFVVYEFYFKGKAKRSA